MANITSNRELHQRRGLKRIETLIPQMRVKAEQEGRQVIKLNSARKGPQAGV
jgi:hypothetical protein